MGAGRPVVLTHDGLLHREVWDAQFRSLPRWYRVARWDRRGYGRSPAAQSAYSSVDDLARVIARVAGGPAVLVGSSSGALVSLDCALDHPGMVSALVLAGPVVSGLPLTEHFLTRGGRRRSADQLPAEEAANPHNLEPKPLSQDSAPALPHLEAVAVPTLIVVGEGDIPDVHAHAGAIEAGVPGGATRVVLAGSGHLPQLEVPESFNDCLERFLATLP